MVAQLRHCPMCGGTANFPAFPWSTTYEGQTFDYVGCSGCGTSYINPVPAAEAMASMYSTGEYHEQYYGDDNRSAYVETVNRLVAHLPLGARVLDYGCGTGHLISQLRKRGIEAEGVEFSATAAAKAASRSGCPVHDLGNDTWRQRGPWQAIHLGDVIEHLPDPGSTVSMLLPSIVKGGILSAEGPLETNASLVNAAIRLVGHVKRRLNPAAVGTFAPHHLIYTNAAAQRGFFRQLPGLTEIEWKVSESGWPYRNNGALRNAVAVAAQALAVLPGMGNRFAVLLRKD